MSQITTGYEHIVIGEEKIPLISGTKTKVIELVIETMAYGWSPEEIHLQHPYLSLGQIYSALAYYWDHTEQFKQDIENRLTKVEDIQKKSKQSPLFVRLKARGLK